MSDAVNTPAPAAEMPTSDASGAESNDNSTLEMVEGQEESQESQEIAEEQAQQEKNLRRKLKLKVDGQEFEEEFDPNDDEYMTRQLQMAKMAQKRAKEAAELRKQVENIAEYLEGARGNPKKLRALIKELGADEKEIAAMIIEDEIANSSKTPEQLENEKLQEELKAMREQREKEKKDWEEREKERLLGQEMERYDIQVTKAIEKSNLPKSPYVVKKMADYMMLGLENGIDLSPEDIIPLVEDEIESDLRELVQAMGVDRAEKFLGKDILSSIRKKNIAKVKASQPAVPLKSAVKDVGAVKTQDISPEKKTFKQFFGV